MSHSETPTKSAQWRWLREQGVKTIVTLIPLELILESLVSRGSFGFRSTVANHLRIQRLRNFTSTSKGQNMGMFTYIRLEAAIA